MTRRTVALVIHEGVQALDVAGPLDVFAEASALLPTDEAYECLLLATDTEAMRASNGMMMVPHLSFAEAGRRFDIALVAGGPNLPYEQPDVAMLDWLRHWGVLAGRHGSSAQERSCSATLACLMGVSRRRTGRTPPSWRQAFPPAR